LDQNSSSNEFPSTSRGIVISSDDELRPTAADDVEIVGVVKPRHLRTPVIVSLSSDEEDNVKKVIKTEEQVSDAVKLFSSPLTKRPNELKPRKPFQPSPVFAATARSLA
jgi:hypothetical protein